MQFQKDKYKNKSRPRKVYIQDNTPDSENGDFLYTDPNGNQYLSPMLDSQEQMMDYVEYHQNILLLTNISHMKKASLSLFRRNTKRANLLF